MGMVAPVYYTADMVRALPEDGNRYEVVYGELLVTPAPRLWHQEIAIRLLRALGEYLDREPVGHLLQSPADISWGPDILVQPDFSYQVLDLDEFAMNAERYGYPEQIKRQSQSAVDELISMIDTRQFPFS